VVRVAGGGMTCPLFVELCAGTAALSLRLHHPRARPPVSRMGAKTGYADVILRVLGLRPGQGSADRTHYMWAEPDDGVRLLLESYRSRELSLAAAEIIRSWKDEDPKELWLRLRDEGPVKGPEVDPREVARWSLVSGWAAHGKDAGSYGGPGRCGDKTCALTIEGAERRYTDAPTLPATITDDARKVEPREVARWMASAVMSMRAEPAAGFAIGSGCNTIWAGGSPQTSIAGRLTDMSELPATITDDARKVEPPQLPAGTVAYMDPPYRGTTGYSHDLGREAVVELARKWEAAGALVCISEAEPIHALIADGWFVVEITGERKGQKRTFSKQQREFLTLSRKPAWKPAVQGQLFG